MSTAQDQFQARRDIIAIDGPAGAGKSTIARRLAHSFGLLNLDTGAMYRAFALRAQRAGVAFDDSAALQALAADTAIRFEPGESENRVLLDGEDVTGLIRTPEISDGASKVSVFPPIRAWMVRMQQQLGAEDGVVMEGRDIGTVVFPNADVKIFLDATPEARAQRRYQQMGPNRSVTPEEILRDIRARDERDRNRADSPLKAADDAVTLDSTELTLDETVAAAEAIVRRKVG